ncbi:MAG: hypothetical protein M3487_10825 [Actinomycetota bacterium]|nr:hypothetical protein [Actinomycetota bacterium]
MTTAAGAADGDGQQLCAHVDGKHRSGPADRLGEMRRQPPGAPSRRRRRQR